MAKTKKPKSKPKLSAKQKKSREIFKLGVKEYNDYKEKNEDGTKKMKTFVKEAFADAYK